MRPKLLEIEGLQSFYEAQTIDFDTLGETGLFGIFGPTGSGKSTILDAITFALYGRVKRAEGGTQGIINSRCDTAHVSFTFELNRNGTRTLYRVERTYKRKKNSRNACEPKVVRLVEATAAGDIPLCEKAMEVSYYIRDLLGLGNEDFTRAVVLPQNSFQEFLLLKNSERRGMLERIFYLEEYGKQLTDKIVRRMSALKSRIDVMSGEIMGYADASDEALENAERAMEEAVEQRKRTEAELKRLEAGYKEAGEVWNLVCELEDISRKEAIHKALEEEISQKRIKLDRAVKADGLVSMIQKKRELEAKLNESKVQLGEVMALLPDVETGLAETKTAYDKIRREAANNQPRLVEQRTRLSDALGIKVEVTQLNSRISAFQSSADEICRAIRSKTETVSKETEEFDQLKLKLDKHAGEMGSLKTEPDYRRHIQEAAGLENEISAMTKTIKQLESKKQIIEKAAKELEQKLTVIKEKIKTDTKAQEDLAAELRQHNDSKPGDRTSLLEFVDQLRSVQQTYQILKMKKKELEAARSKAESHKAGLHVMERKTVEADRVMQSTGAECEQWHRRLDEFVQKLEQNTAYTLSKKLRRGEPCPVCGSIDHPRPAAHCDTDEIVTLEQETEDMRKKLTEAEAAAREAERNALIASQNLKSSSEQADQAAAELEQKIREYEEEGQKLPDKLKNLELEQIRKKLESSDAAVKQMLQAIDRWETVHEEQKGNLERQNTVLTELKLSENGISAELKVNYTNASQMDTELKESVERLERLRLEYTELLEGYSVASAADELKRLSENDRRLRIIEQEIDSARKQMDDRRSLIDNINNELSKLNSEKIKLETDISSLVMQKRNRESKLTELAGDADIEESIRLIDDKLRSIAEDEKEYSDKLEALKKQYNDLHTKRSLLENRLGIYSENLLADESKLMDALGKNGFKSIDEAESCILKQDIQKAFSEEITEYDRVQVNLQAHKDLLQKKLRSRTITEEEWNLIEQKFTELSECAKKCVSDSEVAKNNYAVISKKHERWKELCKNYNEITHKHGLFEQIQKLLKAEHRKDNSFIDYIAEERLRYVAAKASLTLGVMTKHRYALELDAESGFIIRDHANGGMHRMVTSLSGGETFLTSLSLALALSEQIQLKGQSPLEFFFLDEGFGTLDQELLDTVIDSLERLSSKERVIGIISHVPELKCRIGRRLVVTPPTFDGCGSRVAVEKA